MMAEMKRKPVFGGGMLAPITPSAEEEAAIAEAAKDKGWTDRGTASDADTADLAVVEEGLGAKPKTATAKKAAPKTKVNKSRVKQRRKPPVSEEFPDLVAHYMELIAAGEPIPNPPNPMWHKVDRHRVYSMFPVHTAAALQAFSDAKGYRQLWMGIDELLHKSGIYERNISASQ